MTISPGNVAAALPEGYRIPDEPKPGPLEAWATRPFWPLLGIMLGGVWLGWPWFAFNAFALGTPTRWRELSVLAAGLVGIFGLVSAEIWAYEAGHLSQSALAYASLGPVVLKLGVGFWIFKQQEVASDLWEYFGGRPRNGSILLFLGFFLGNRVTAWLAEVSTLLWWVLS
jgi:hypothetical protein